MISLRNFFVTDAAVLQQHNGMSIEENQKMIAEWNTFQYNGKYFEMFAVDFEGEIVGMLSLFQHSDSVISIGEEIFMPFQHKGFGEGAMNLALEICKNKGYKIICQQVRSDNIASIKMHNRLGFETDGYGYLNKKGHEVFIFLKSL